MIAAACVALMSESGGPGPTDLRFSFAGFRGGGPRPALRFPQACVEETVHAVFARQALAAGAADATEAFVQRLGLRIRRARQEGFDLRFVLVLENRAGGV